MFPSELPQIEQFQFNANGVNGGQAVRVMCMVTSGDLPLDIYWLKDGQPLLRSIYHKIDEYTLILSLRQTKIGDAGNYTCVASNKAGESRKWSTLRIKGKSVSVVYFSVWLLLSSLLLFEILTKPKKKKILSFKSNYSRLWLEFI